MSAPNKIEVLLFDMGGIVIEIDFDLALQTWKQWTLLSIEEMRHRFKHDEAYEQHERGEIEASEILHICAGCLRWRLVTQKLLRAGMQFLSMRFRRH